MTNYIDDPLSKLLPDEEPTNSGYDASNHRAVNVANQQAARKRSNKEEVIRALMDQDKCREWLYDLLERCHIFSTPYRQNPYDTAFNAGEQNIGNIILADLSSIAPTKYVELCREGYERNRAENDAREKAAKEESLT